ncbi:Efflux pump radE [Lachnellula suecica]|uniref:Efflux pump radE n=1 Tax=Lachnellula suecica TaxID=602035 RepID=A0A8T9CAC3_9HELO|nr:Efflux pump radE [Lachnellula suecica]
MSSDTTRQNSASATDVEKQQQDTSIHTSDNKEKDPNVVDWDGEDDPEKPVNWTGKKKWANGGLLAAMTFITPLASSMFAPGVEDVLIEFHSSSTLLASLTVSIYILGYALGPLLVAPLSEMYGRVPLYHASNVLFCIFTMACAVSSNLNMLIAFRFFAGAAGSTPITIGGGSFGDMFSVEERGKAIAIWSMGPLLGPVIGPVAGGFLAESAGWRWVFWLILILAGILTIMMFIFLKETYPVALLEQKAARLRKSTGNPNLRSALTLDLPPRELFKRTIFRPIKMFLSPIVLLLSTYMAFVYGILYLLFTTITDVFIDTYGFSQGTSGLAYLGLGIGMFAGLIAFGIGSDKLIKTLSAKNGGVMKPEFRFPPMIPASFFVPAGLLLYGWTAKYGVFWIVPIIGTGLVGTGLIGSFMPISTYLIDAFTIHSASALAANTILRSLFGCFLPLAGPPLYEKLGLGWGNSLLAFIAMAMIPIPVMFWRYGESIRTNQRFKINF